MEFIFPVGFTVFWPNDLYCKQNSKYVTPYRIMLIVLVMEVIGQGYRASAAAGTDIFWAVGYIILGEFLEFVELIEFVY